MSEKKGDGGDSAVEELQKLEITELHYNPKDSKDIKGTDFWTKSKKSIKVPNYVDTKNPVKLVSYLIDTEGVENIGNLSLIIGNFKESDHGTIIPVNGYPNCMDGVYVVVSDPDNLDVKDIYKTDRFLDEKKLVEKTIGTGTLIKPSNGKIVESYMNICKH